VLKEYQDKLEQLNERLRKQSLTDDVTGFDNTRFLHQYLDRHLNSKSAERDKRQLLMAADHCLFQSKKEGKDRISAAKHLSAGTSG